MRIPIESVLASCLLLGGASTNVHADPADPPAAETATTTLVVTSAAFDANQPIPSDYTCEGAGESPPLMWAGVPASARSLAILVDDPGAQHGDNAHWIVTNIRPTAISLAANGALPEGAVATTSGNAVNGYIGPCPSNGMHEYHFVVYALDTTIPEPSNREAFLRAIDGHVVGVGQLVGTFTKVGVDTMP